MNTVNSFMSFLLVCYGDQIPFFQIDTNSNLKWLEIARESLASTEDNALTQVENLNSYGVFFVGYKDDRDISQQV